MNLPVKRIIPLSEPEISGNEWKYVKDCLDSTWVSYVGEYVTRFEEAVANFVGSRYGVAIVSGTAALHMSLIVRDVLPGDEVLVPTLTFIAPVNVVTYCRAHPVFMDADPDTLCMDVGKVSDFIERKCNHREDGYLYNKLTKRRVRAIIPVHIFGHPVDMDAMVEMSQRYRLDIIEDATESLGSLYKGRMTGTIGVAGCFSFNGNKLITTGGGGLIVTEDEAVARRARHLSTQAKSDPFEYDHDDIGYNYRMTNIQAAVGLAQMERIKDFIEIKRRNAQLYKELLGGLEPVKFIGEQAWARSNYWFYTIKVPKENRKPLMDHLLSHGIQVRPIWRLIHTLPMYREHQTYAIDKAVEAYETCFNLPCSVGLPREDVAYVASLIRSYFERS